jgi:hypothetical protein
MQHAPVIDQKRVACSCEGARKHFSGRQDSPDLLASRFSDSTCGPQEFLIPPNAAANLDLFAEPHQVDCSVPWSTRFYDRPRHDVQRDGLDDTFAIDQERRNVGIPFDASKQKITGRTTPMSQIGVERETVESIDAAVGVWC